MKMFTYENQGINTYLVYKVAEDDVIDTLALGMITNNHISGLAATTSVQMDASKYIKYNVSAKISVSQFFLGSVNRARLLGVFNGIVNALLSSEDYMIAPDMILLDLDYIFVDVSNCDTVLICLPVCDTEAPVVDLSNFFKNIMFSTQFDQTENCDYVAAIMNHLNSTPSFSLVDFKGLLDNLRMNTPKPEKKSVQPAVNSGKQEVTGLKKPLVPPTPQVVHNTEKQQTSVVSSEKNFVSVETDATSNIADFPENTTSVETHSGGYEIPGYDKKDNSKSNKKEKNKSKSGKKEKNKEKAIHQESDEKPMSIMYLLQHYSKENKAIYDAQQAAKKGKKTVEPEPTKRQVSKNSGGMGFSIPGQEAPDITSVSETYEQKKAQIQRQVVQINETKNEIQQKVQEKIQQKVQTSTIVQEKIKNTASVAQNDFRNGFVGGKANFGETVVLSNSVAGETTVLNGGNILEKKLYPYIIRRKNSDRVLVDKPVFRIGKERSYVDYFIGDNTAISRSHANIVIRDQRYYIVDTNSTNHTYINGQMIPSNTEFEIINGTRIHFANEEFEFVLSDWKE